MNRFEKVVLLHGIRTNGNWQKSLGDALSQRGHPHETYDFGQFSLPSFLSSRARHREIERFYDWYSEVRSRSENSAKKKREFRPHVVAHSFGAYLIGYPGILDLVAAGSQQEVRLFSAQRLFSARPLRTALVAFPRGTSSAPSVQARFYVRIGRGM